MLKVFDDRKRELYFARAPRRIVSLVPSDTDTLFALGAGERVVGRTEYCVEPADRVAAIPTCGGTKNVDVAAVSALEPDLIVANQEENARPQLEKLAQARLPVFVSFPKRVADGVALMARLARVLGVEGEPGARALIRRGYEVVRYAEAAAPARGAVRVFAPIWMDPLMTLGGETFGSDMIALAGGVNVFADRERRYPLAADLRGEPAVDPGGRDTRYPRVTLDEVVGRAPDVVLLPNEPHEFSEADADVFRERGLTVRFCDGKDLFWYGARSVGGLGRLTAVLDGLR
jgi:ABC-type Fe3+-hydroxamate transport system substrate-binding protein